MFYTKETSTGKSMTEERTANNPQDIKAMLASLPNGIPSIGDLTARPVRDAKQGGQPGLKSGVIYIENIFIFNLY